MWNQCALEEKLESVDVLGRGHGVTELSGCEGQRHE